MWMIITLLSGIVASFAAGRYTLHILARNRARAVAWDTLLVTLNSLPAFALWAGNSVPAIVCWIVGNAIGTYLALL